MKLLYAGLICLVLAVPCAARIITVDDDGPADFDTIQAAIDDADDGDTVVVNDGTYTGEGNRDIDFKGKSITVRSESGPEDCMVDCQGSEGNFHRGFYFHSGEDQNSVVDGFTIGNGFHGRGAGILCIGSSPIIRNNVITGNEIAYDADGGAGIGCWRGASPTIIDNVISNNTCAPGGGGGGIRCYEAGSPTITNNIISRNTASQGGGMCVDFSSPTISDCAFSGNSATGMGGGILTDSNMVLTNCTFIGNSARTGGGMYNYRCNAMLSNCYFSVNSSQYDGGAIFNTRATSPTVKNCVFTANSAGTAGGAIYNDGYAGDKPPTFTNCTFAANSALYGNALACDSHVQKYPSSLQVSNCILWDGGNEISNADGSIITITYSDVQGGWPGEGNLDAEPCFADPNDGNYHLKSQAGRWDPKSQSWVRDDVTSPCIDAGDPASPIGHEPFPNGGITNMGAYGGTTEASKSYFDEPVCETIVAGDINGDCKIDWADLRLMALHWLQEDR